MSKTNEIKQIMFNKAYQSLNNINNNDKSMVVVLTSFLTSPKNYINRIKNNKDEINATIIDNAEVLEKLNKLFSLRELFTEAHFLYQSLKLNSVHPNLHNLYKKYDSIYISKENTFIYSPEEIATNLQNYIESLDLDYSKIGDLFIEVEKNEEVNKVYKTKVAGSISPFKNKSIVR